MRNLFFGLILGVLGFYGYHKFRDSAAQRQRQEQEYARPAQQAAPYNSPSVHTTAADTSIPAAEDPGSEPLPVPEPAFDVEKSATTAVQPEPPAASAPAFRCDGRQHCSQMRSCEEANWMLRNCSGMKMDGDRDGAPCEQGPC